MIVTVNIPVNHAGDLVGYANAETGKCRVKQLIDLQTNSSRVRFVPSQSDAPRSFSVRIQACQLFFSISHLEECCNLTNGRWCSAVALDRKLE